ANNVLAHVPDLNGFVEGLRLLLKDDGVAIIEVPSLRDMIERVEFDTIYHEHLCYFSLTALHRLAARHDLTIVDVEHLAIHRGTVKQGLFTPGSHLPIVAPERLLADLPRYTLLLVWNFADEVLQQQAEYRRRGGRFIIPSAEPRIV